MIPGRMVGNDRDLASVEKAVPDAVVLVDVLKRVVPSARLGQGAGSVGQEHGPQPLEEFAAIIGGVGQVGEVDGSVVDLDGRLMLGGVEQCCDQVVSGGAVAVPGEEAADVDQGLEREFRGRRVERPGVLEDAELGPAQICG
ncbi:MULTISPECIES: hypothetical protein [unclassified Frankia]|uniref:hypothetical protein n=1 Tax=unclassified Frankia TaxID=2632575 RepID=UPI002AD31BEC|nr:MULTISPECIES: hypothetical protein [unclassified Frankia]